MSLYIHQASPFTQQFTMYPNLAGNGILIERSVSELYNKIVYYRNVSLEIHLHRHVDDS